MPGAYDGTTNEFKQSIIAPELQKVIDQVTKYATTPIGGARGQTAAQGRALLGTGEMVKGIQQQGMQDTSEMAKLGVQEAGTMKRLGITEAGATERTKIATQPSLIKETKPVPSYLQNMISGGVGAGKATEGKWWEKMGATDLSDYWGIK